MSTAAGSRLRVFLSYRRDDCGIHAGRLADNLRDRAGIDVFLDVDAIAIGENFKARIEREIERCDVVIVMIGDDWLTLMGRDGRPRIFDPLDWIHLEIRAALDRDVPVVPVLVEGAAMPQPDELPEPIQELAYRQGAEIRVTHWTADVDQFMRLLVPTKPEPKPPVRQGVTPSRARTKLDLDAAARFIATVPEGRWTSYKEVARAGGAPSGAQAVGMWIQRNGAELRRVWRVLQTSGGVSPGWTPASPDHPIDGPAVSERLQREGVRFDGSHRADARLLWTLEDAVDAGFSLAAEPTPSEQVVVVVAGRVAYPDYLTSSTYVCQAGRSFRPFAHIGFYAGREIKREVPRVLEHRAEVPFTRATLTVLRATGEPADARVADLVEATLDHPDRFLVPRSEGEPYDVYLLSAPDDPATLRLPAPIRHEGSGAWTQMHRYVPFAALERGPSTTADLPR